MATVLVGVMGRDSWAALSMVPGAWSVSSGYSPSFVLILGFSCLLYSLAVPVVWSFLRGTRMNAFAAACYSLLQLDW